MNTSAQPASDGATPATPQRRYIVGIDLGTTNCSVASVDTHSPDWTVENFLIPQLTAPGQVEARSTLPSFCYQAVENEFPRGSLRTPWMNVDPDYVVGIMARDQGALVSGRQISSAKSWLCHPGVDRQSPLLPWNGLPEVQRFSPVEISSRYLKHLREAWDAAHPDEPLAQCDVVVTLPASFDEVARDLTVKAAAKAGLQRILLIEEPQAAFYDWIHRHAADWGKLVSPGDNILVCDIGGGTSDFTLIRVRQSESGKVQFQRMAVGDHLILGGDNFDLALAQHLEAGLKRSDPLEPRVWGSLLRQCRAAKETLLGENPPEKLVLSVSSGGSKLLATTLRFEVTREECQRLLLDGFFPRVSLGDRPTTKRAGFQEFGLPFAADAAITRYLSAFLVAHAADTPATTVEFPNGLKAVRPDLLLFNGGVFLSAEIRDRVVDVLHDWFGPDTRDGWKLRVLEFDRLDLAVARGAAYYGVVRRGKGERISAGLARSYYLGVATATAEQAEPSEDRSRTLQGVCLVPSGMEPGEEIDLRDRPFELLVSQPVEFPLFVSSTRLTDKPGTLVPIEQGQLTPLPALITVMQSRQTGTNDHVAVTVHARLTEIGTLDMWCAAVADKRTWRLQFDVRSATQTDVAAVSTAGEQQGIVDETIIAPCADVLRSAFSGSSTDVSGVVRRLSDVVGKPRADWPATLLRRLWDVLMELEPSRKKSPEHESRWLNLLGFCLRPGFGVAADDYRVQESRRSVYAKLVHSTPAVLGEWWIMWRRLAGGLTLGQQGVIFDLVWPQIRQQFKSVANRGQAATPPRESAELWRLLASLELLAPARKIDMGDLAADLLHKKQGAGIRPALLWSIVRLGARVPGYGPLNTVVPPETAWKWLRSVRESTVPGDLSAEAVRSQLGLTHLLYMQLARKTGDRFRDLPEQQRETVLGWLQLEYDAATSATSEAASVGNVASAAERSRGDAATDEVRDESPSTSALQLRLAHYIDLLRNPGRLDREEQSLMFGESLPVGLRLPGE